MSKQGLESEGGGMKMKCDFCEQKFPVEELETIKGALHECGDVQELKVCSDCAEWIEENAGRKVDR